MGSRLESKKYKTNILIKNIFLRLIDLNDDVVYTSVSIFLE